jgi:O-acetyl-ADP-ribose deacetylase (regulator of RNase III)
MHAPHIVLCAVSDRMAAAWRTVADGRPSIEAHTGSVLDIAADAVVSPANSFGWMRGGIDAVYAKAWPTIEQRVRSAVLALHGGELPVGQAVVVETGGVRPGWLISAPTMRSPGELLPEDTVHPYLAALAVFRLWRDTRLEDGRPLAEVITTIAMPGLGTGVGGVAPESCARQVTAAWDETFGTQPAEVAPRIGGDNLNTS